MTSTDDGDSPDRAFQRRVGANIRRLRTDRGLTMEALAWAAGISKGYLSRVESGHHAPSLRVLRLLARELGVQPARLLELELNGAAVIPQEPDG